MNNKPRQVLCDLITHHGTSLAEDRGRCSALLRDACGHFKSETNVLIVAMDEGIPTALVKDRNSGPVRLLAQRLTKRLQDDRHLTQEAAFWAVESWALALGFSVKDLKQAVSLRRHRIQTGDKTHPHKIHPIPAQRPNQAARSSTPPS